MRFGHFQGEKHFACCKVYQDTFHLVQRLARSVNKRHQFGWSAIGKLQNIFLYLPAGSAATQPGFWLLFRQLMGLTQPSAAGGKKKQPKKWLHCAAIWLHVCSHTCSQMAAQMQPNGRMFAAKTYLFAADECSHLAACMQPLCSHAQNMQPMCSHGKLCAANVQPMCSHPVLQQPRPCEKHVETFLVRY